MDAWAYQRGVGLSFIRPGKPNDNAYIEKAGSTSETPRAGAQD
jgi:transposase InsO family protein